MLLDGQNLILRTMKRPYTGFIIKFEFNPPFLVRKGKTGC